MSRIRSTHPELATDEAFMSMSLAAKASWQLLWTQCDDHGVFEWKPVVLKARILPADNIDFAAVLEEFIALGVVSRFEVDGKPFGVVRNFGKFQKPKHPSYRYDLPEALRTFAGFKPSDYGSPPPVLPPDTGKSSATGVGVGVGEEKKKEPIVQRKGAAPNLLERLLEANGLGTGFREERNIGLMSVAPILGLLEAGYDLDLDVLPAIRSRPNPKARTWSYFDGQIRDYRATRVRAASLKAPPEAAEKTAAWPLDRWRRMVEHWQETGDWGEALGPKPGEPGCRVPAELLRAAA